MKISHTFGTFIKEKRQQRDISLRKFADQIGISPVYLSNLENDRMPAPKDEVVSTMARLTENVRNTMWRITILPSSMQ